MVAKLLDQIELHGRGPSASTSSSSAGDHVSEPGAFRPYPEYVNIHKFEHTSRFNLFLLSFP